jgi:hypothetical protein
MVAIECFPSFSAAEQGNNHATMPGLRKSDA